MVGPYATMRSPPLALDGRTAGREEDSQDAKKGRDRRASLTVAASAYKDDGFVNYGAHGDGSPLRALHSDARRSRSRPRLAATKTSSSSFFTTASRVRLHSRCTADKHAYTVGPEFRVRTGRFTAGAAEITSM